jgi:C4-dicarboxylate-specific signal transduction histidine kinase
MTTGTLLEEEIRIRRADGVYRWFHARTLPVRGTDGRITAWYGLMTDIEDRKGAEEELRRTEAELAHASRVSSLGVLTASIAHEVNQPLMALNIDAGTCQLMLSANPPNVEGAREAAGRTIRDGKHAAEVITRLHALFKKKDPTPEMLDLNEAAREVVALSLGRLQRDRVILRQELADDIPPINGDRVQLQQVILNLVLNASDAMSGVEDRPKVLTIRTEQVGDAVRLTVQDAGIGFQSEAVGKLFQPFYTTKDGGMGIGLSISRSIIESHHGRIWAAPNDGPGATFSFSIPGPEGVTARAKRASA